MNILDALLLLTLWGDFDVNDDAGPKPTGQKLADDWNKFKVIGVCFLLCICERMISHNPLYRIVHTEQPPLCRSGRREEAHADVRAELRADCGAQSAVRAGQGAVPRRPESELR